MAAFLKTDGGRRAAGFDGTTSDCVTRAIAVALEKPYQEVYDSLAGLMAKERLKRKRGSPRNGVHRSTYERYLKESGWEFVPTMGIGTGCKVHLKADELPKGRIIARVSKHLVAVIDGTIYDNHDPSRGGTRCVYGYFRKLQAAADPQAAVLASLEELVNSPNAKQNAMWDRARAALEAAKTANRKATVMRFAKKPRCGHDPIHTRSNGECRHKDCPEGNRNGMEAN